MLSPYRILDLTDHRGHLAGLMLASLGAEVIKIEPPGGSPVRSMGPLHHGESLTFAAYDRGKASVVLDLDSPTGRHRFVELVAGTDVLLESFDNGHLEQRGLGPADLLAVNPALVHVSISGHGRTGPRAGWRATDLTVMASSCSLALNGDRDRAPVRVSAPQAFHFGGAAATGAALLALIERSRSGRGQIVDVSAQQVAAIATQAGVLSHGVNAPVPSRTGGGVSVGGIDLQLVYPAADGYVSITHVFGEVIGPVTARLMACVHEAGFCSAEMADADWVDYAVKLEAGEYSVEHWSEAKAAVTAFTSSLTKAQLLDLAIERRLLVAPIATTADVVASEHWAERGYFAPVRLVSGEAVSAPNGFAKFSSVHPHHLDRVRQVGADTEAVLEGPARTPWLDGPPISEAAPGSPPLAGVHVLDFTWSLAGPFSTRVLADFGATVVKVESIRKIDAARGFMPLWDNEPGAENSALFDDANAGKLSVGVDLSTEEGREVALDLVEWADLVVESFSAGSMASLGLGYERLKTRNPAVILLSTNLAGQTGPLAGFAGYGNLGAALGGFYGLAGWSDRPPAGPFGAYTDYTSTHFMVASMLAALDHRRRTGEGCAIDLAQAEAAMYFVAPALMAAAADGTVLQRDGNRDPRLAPHGVYPCAGDDRWIAIACESDQAWSALCRLMERPELARDLGLATSAGRLAAADRLDALISDWTRRHRDESLHHLLQEAGIAAYRVQNSPECLDDPQLVARGHFVELAHPDRGCLVENSRFRLQRTPGGPANRAPMIGEHTFEVLTEILGYDVDRVAELAAAEVLE